MLGQTPGMAYLINGTKIEDSAIADEFESIKDHYQSLGEVVCCDRDEEFWQYARDNIVNRTLLEQESIARFGEISDEEVDRRFAQMIEEHGGEQNFYDNTGFNKGDEQVLRRRLRSSLVIDRLLDAELGEPEPPTDEQLEKYYRDNIERYLTEEEVRVSQLFIEPTSHEAAKEAFLELRKVRDEILAGKDFDQAAREHGSDEKREIDLGFLKQGETMPEVESVMFSMQVGEVSPIVATHYGFHLFKITDRKAPAPKPREEVGGLEEQFQLEVRNRQVEELIAGLKERGSVEEINE